MEEFAAEVYRFNYISDDHHAMWRLGQDVE